MKALLMKDLHVLWRLLKPIFLMIVFFALIPSNFQNTFAITYAAMIPYSSFSADESCKWNRLAAMLPYSERDMVVSKYILGLIAILGTAVLTAAIRMVMTLLGFGTMRLSLIVTAAAASVTIMDITLPLVFRFGAERGRMLLVLLVVMLVCVSAGFLSLLGVHAQAGISLAWVSVAFPAAAVVATAVSIPVSINMFRRQKG